MKVYVVRHAEAVALDAPGVSRDEERPLSEHGLATLPALSQTLRRRGGGPARILTSPLVRARQTAEGIAQHWGGPLEIVETPLLAPGAKKRDLTAYLRALDSATVVLVGHNPDLSELVGWFIGNKHIGINLDKAGVALLEFDHELAKGQGHLAWLITPDWLQ